LEIELFWKRALFFWGFITTALVGYSVARDKAPFVGLVFCALGVVAAEVWMLANRGSKYWQEVWEKRVERMEVPAIGLMFGAKEESTSKGTWLSGRRFSVSRLAIAFSDFVFLAWVFLFVHQALGIEHLTVMEWGLIISTALMGLLLLRLGRSSSGSKSPPSEHPANSPQESDAQAEDEPARRRWNVERMRDTADVRLHEAATLCQTFPSAGDGGSLLNLLAFELLLKAAHTAYVGVPKRSHGYLALMSRLPLTVQERLWSVAVTAPGVPADHGFEDREHLLQSWSRNFVRLRYPFESYTDLDPEAYQARSEAWVAEGAKTEDADFQYYPTELDGLAFALKREIELWLTT